MRAALFVSFVLVNLAISSLATAFFDDPIDHAKLEAEAKRLAALREELGNEAFGRHVVEKFEAIVPMVPRSHPLHEQYTKTPQRPEHEYAVRQYFYYAALDELSKTDHQPALATLKRVILLSQMRVEGAYQMPYFDSLIARDATEAYFAIAAGGKSAARREEVLADAIEWLADPFTLVDAITQYGREITPHLLTKDFTRRIANWPPAAVGNIGDAVGRDPTLGFDDAALVKLAESNKVDLAGVGVVAVASRNSIEAADRFDVVAKQLRQAIAELDRKPYVTERPEKKQAAAERCLYYVMRAIKTDLRPAYRPLVLKAMLQTPSWGWGSLLGKLDLTQTDIEALLTAATSPDHPESDKAALLRLLIRLDVADAHQPVLAFIERNRLKAIGHEDETQRENYPALGLDSLDVANWVKWAEEISSRKSQGEIRSKSQQQE